ncbi:MAG: hypothetical protein ACUVT3_03370 [Ignavibacterium sp.]
MIKNYKPIACGLYDELETRSIKKQKCKITFVDNSGVIQTIDCIISDLFARDKVEYLRTDGGQEVRLLMM